MNLRSPLTRTCTGSGLVTIIIGDRIVPVRPAPGSAQLVTDRDTSVAGLDHAA